MATPSQITANRANAQFCTGPKTEAGIEKSKSNSLKHGLTSKQVVIKGEDPDEYDQFRADVITQYRPEGIVECHWVDEIAAAMWRLRRARAYEAQALSRGADDIFSPDNGPESRAFDRLMRYTGSIERTLKHALKELQTLQKERRERQALQSQIAAQREFMNARQAAREQEIGFVSSPAAAAQFPNISPILTKAVGAIPKHPQR